MSLFAVVIPYVLHAFIRNWCSKKSKKIQKKVRKKNNIITDTHELNF